MEHRTYFSGENKMQAVSDFFVLCYTWHLSSKAEV